MKWDHSVQIYISTAYTRTPVAHYQIPIKITAFSMHPPWKGFLFKYMWRIKYANTPKLVAPFFCVDPTFPFQFPCKKNQALNQRKKNQWSLLIPIPIPMQN